MSGTKVLTGITGEKKASFGYNSRRIKRYGKLTVLM
jgi:hypothetical protein